jgi:phosphate starvation-inducible protein PhoH
LEKIIQTMRSRVEELNNAIAILKEAQKETINADQMELNL